ncbi:hypothetical protein [Gilvibacter sediminis]|uniref:hypothetical protein n=1 Tax=Gilvibacter sediminis TaxID=379071 RepID=UPI00234FFC7A|nr:hypothetical protein [Gilvibacter sediminis]MDC7997544.1 hypothetical protein [Gilvibacter sediminis]
MKVFSKLLMLLIGLVMISCNFTEQMTMNEDGSGRLSVNFDASELMGMAGEMGGGDEDGEKEKVDSIIDFKEFIRENKDSIMSLPAKERAEIMAMENFKMRMLIDEEEGVMKFNIFSDFKNVSEANNINDGFNSLNGLMNAGGDAGQQQPKNDESVKVSYTFENNVFKRDAYIVDAEKYQTQIDSIKSMEMFFSSSSYKLEYTFPRKIKSTNRETATFSNDGKTLYYSVGFMDYMKDPDLMDIEVVLED